MSESYKATVMASIISAINSKAAPQKGAVNGRWGQKKGWRRLAMDKKADIEGRLNALLTKDEVALVDKEVIQSLLNGIIDGRMRIEDRNEANRIIVEYSRLIRKPRVRKKPTKGMIRQMEKAASTFSHSVFMACQACDNLQDTNYSWITPEERRGMILKLGASAIRLLEVQAKLMERENDNC